MFPIEALQRNRRNRRLPAMTSAVTTRRKPRDEEIETYGLTHIGKVRGSNNDHFLLASMHKNLAVHGTSLPSLTNLPAAAPSPG